MSVSASRIIPEVSPSRWAIIRSISRLTRSSRRWVEASRTISA